MPDGKILLRVNPILFKGTEIWVSAAGTEMRNLDFDADIFEDLKVDGFAGSGAMFGLPLFFNHFFTCGFSYSTNFITSIFNLLP